MTCTDCRPKHIKQVMRLPGLQHSESLEQLTPEEQAVFSVIRQVEELEQSEPEDDRLSSAAYYFSQECGEGNHHSLCEDLNCACPCHDVPAYTG